MAKFSLPLWGGWRGEAKTGGEVWAKREAQRLSANSLPWPLHGLSLPSRGGQEL
jgi:hypothetical protein